MIKCPVNECKSTRIKRVDVGGTGWFTCEYGHVIARDTSEEIDNLAKAISVLAEGIVAQRKASTDVLCKKLENIANAITNAAS